MYNLQIIFSQSYNNMIADVVVSTYDYDPDMDCFYYEDSDGNYAYIPKDAVVYFGVPIIHHPEGKNKR